MERWISLRREMSCVSAGSTPPARPTDGSQSQTRTIGPKTCFAIAIMLCVLIQDPVQLETPMKMASFWLDFNSFSPVQCPNDHLCPTDKLKPRLQLLSRSLAAVGVQASACLRSGRPVITRIAANELSWTV